MQEYKTSWREKICFGVGAVGLDLSYGMFYSFLSYYLSSVLGLKEAFLLLLTPIARIWDGINDPMMGTIVDNTRTKHGNTDLGYLSVLYATQLYSFYFLQTLE